VEFTDSVLGIAIVGKLDKGEAWLDVHVADSAEAAKDVFDIANVDFTRKVANVDSYGEGVRRREREGRERGRES
jgi:hypothetical protein